MTASRLFDRARADAAAADFAYRLHARIGCAFPVLGRRLNIRAFQRRAAYARHYRAGVAALVREG